MNKKPGRNDPCPCGSGKKFKNCCFLSSQSRSQTGRKLTAKWLNAPQSPNLIERTFGNIIAPHGQGFVPPPREEETNVNE